QLHEIPEPAFEEIKTSAFISQELKRMGYDVKNIAKTGVIATCQGREEGPCVAIRADIDCVTHHINNELVYRHSCGHDAHSSIALGVAKRFAANDCKDFKGTLTFIFQPAEETGQGAKAIVDEGG